MHPDQNHLGQPVGELLENWTPPAFPEREAMVGRTCRLAPLSTEQHGKQLFAAFSADSEGALWTYLPSGPFETEAQFLEWIEACSRKTDPQFYAIVDANSGDAVGIASYLRIDPVQ